MIENNCNPLLKLCNSTGDTCTGLQTHTASTQQWSPSLHPFSNSHLIPQQAAGEVSVGLSNSAEICNSHKALHDLLTCPKAAGNSRGKAFSEPAAKEGAATALKSLFCCGGFLNASENQLTGQRSKNCLKSQIFLGKNQFKADRNTCLLRSSPKLDLCLTSAFSKDDAEQGTKARDGQEMDMATMGRRIPSSRGISLKETRTQSGKNALCINKQILKKQ